MLFTLTSSELCDQLTKLGLSQSFQTIFIMKILLSGIYSNAMHSSHLTFWRLHVPPQRRLTFAGLRGVIGLSQKIEPFITTAERTTNPEVFIVLPGGYFWAPCTRSHGITLVRESCLASAGESFLDGAGMRPSCKHAHQPTATRGISMLINGFRNVQV